MVGIYYAFKWLNTLADEETAAPGKMIANQSVDLADLADKIEPIMDKMAHPSDIFANEDFEEAVAALASETYTLEQASNYALGANWVLKCIGYEALYRRDDSANMVERALNAVRSTYAWPLFFLLRYVDAKASDPVSVQILSSARSWWRDNPVVIECISAYLERKIADGEQIVFGQKFTDLGTYRKKKVREFIDVLPDSLRSELIRKLNQHESEAIDRSFLRSIGEIFSRERVSDPVFDTRQISRLRKEMLDELERSEPRSILVVGALGVGKSALRRAFANDLLDRNWYVFQTSAASLVADKIYIGEIEGQVRRLSQNASVKKRVALYVEDLPELGDFGRSMKKDSSILDQLWPSFESHKMFMVSETTASGLQALIRKHPTLPTIMKVMHMQPVAEAEASDLAVHLLEHLQVDLDAGQATAVVSETLQLSQQYLSHKSMPGSVLSLLQLAVLRSQHEDDGQALGRVHVLGALSQISGLPQEVLDEKQQLDIEAVKNSFLRQVIGQDEAVECLVERIAMLKAGLTDPSRPVGVFLFAGPTGTGKTEIAKTLAELLFGSPEQMIRLDMSEYLDADSIGRIIGQNNRDIASGSLVNRIRERPFSVILLDEFEKAHAKVWDIFLQVFDDGRLSDSQGQLADFRHAIIILTSNLGATINNEAGVGFTSTRGGFSSPDVLKSVNRTFRREFINRLDRVVVFRPLSREVMRAILGKELEKALERRGLRTKEWAVEWEDSAIEFLLTEGFTPDLGARPLRRAIERHLLAPLSITMVQNRVPEGEQFLFVRSNGEALQVEFIDPDADLDTEGERSGAEGERSSISDLPGLILSNGNAGNATEFLAAEMNAVAERVESDVWIETKADYLAELNQDGFWDREDRYDVLDRIELIDRLDSAASVLGSLSGRLQQNTNNTKLIKSIANRLFVLREGLKDLDLERPTQAYLGIRLVTADSGLDGADEFLQNLIDMYQNWARARGMRLGELDTKNSRYQALFAVSGFGSHGVLSLESGLHVFEVPKNKSRFNRIRARVQVAPVPATAQEKQVNRGTKATSCLNEAALKVEIVRRYRQQPSPLVRDSIRGWRTGRLDRVFDGNFDVLT
jgi:ATP-dependent Clp protease ATP-binding subunit ClpC